MKSIRKMELRWSRVSVVKDGGSEYSKTVRGSIEIVGVINTLIGDEVHEVVIALHLDTKNKIVGYHEVSRGGIAGSAVTPADVFRSILLSGASKMILAYNHPSELINNN
jgi:DNA repair protein RadC